MSPEQYLLGLLLEMEAVSLSEAILAFEGDSERLRHVLLLYLDRQTVVFEEGGTPLPHWRVAAILREPDVFETMGNVAITLSPHAAKLLEDGKW